MAIITTTEGMYQIINGFLREGVGMTGVYYGFYSNNYTPVKTSILSNFTLPSLGTVPQHLVESSAWGSPSESGGVVTLTASQVTLTIAGAVTLYGLVVWDPEDDTVMWAEKFDTALVYGAGGGELKFTPKYQVTMPLVA